MGLNRSELPLHHAARLGYRIVCQLLAAPTRSAGVLDAANTVGYSALHLAAENGHTACVKVLLAARAQVDNAAVPHGCRTATHFATICGHVETLEELLERDANVNAADNMGLTPLHLAAQRADPQCTSMLLRHRADAHRRGGHEDALPSELVPVGSSVAIDKVRRLLSAYGRTVVPGRTDNRFEVKG